MFVADLFENTISKTVVVLPGGFHPFHPGHLSLYKSAQQAFPGADIYYAATGDTSERPFDFADKQQLATIAGVPAGHFVQVKSPFQAKEITQHFDPASTVLIFARSEKDQGGIKAGGVKKDGSPAYLQPLSKNPQPMSKHGYVAYLPTIEFKAGPSGVTSATQIRNMWPTASDAAKQQIVQDLYPRDSKTALAILNKYLGNEVNESGKMDVGSVSLLKKARAAHPLAKSDEQALALYINDKEERDVNRLDRENDQEDSMIDQLMSIDSDIQQKIKQLQAQIAELKEDASGVIASKSQAKDPRYSMSLTRDVRPGQVNKNLRAFKLAEVDSMSSAITNLQQQYANNVKDDIEYWTKELAQATDPTLQAGYKKKIFALRQKLEKLQGLN